MEDAKYHLVSVVMSIIVCYFKGCLSECKGFIISNLVPTRTSVKYWHYMIDEAKSFSGRDVFSLETISLCHVPTSQ